jgi:hypothetical protein
MKNILLILISVFPFVFLSAQDTTFYEGNHKFKDTIYLSDGTYIAGQDDLGGGGGGDTTLFAHDVDSAKNDFSVGNDLTVGRYATIQNNLYIGNTDISLQQISEQFRISYASGINPCVSKLFTASVRDMYHEIADGGGTTWRWGKDGSTEFVTTFKKTVDFDDRARFDNGVYFGSENARIINDDPDGISIEPVGNITLDAGVNGSDLFIDAASGDVNIGASLNLSDYTNSSPADGDIWYDATNYGHAFYDFNRILTGSGTITLNYAYVKIGTANPATGFQMNVSTRSILEVQYGSGNFDVDMTGVGAIYRCTKHDGDIDLSAQAHIEVGDMNVTVTVEDAADYSILTMSNATITINSGATRTTIIGANNTVTDNGTTTQDISTLFP